MPARRSSDLFRLLLIEDDEARAITFRRWLLPGVQLTWAKSAGQAIGLIQRDRGYVYGGVLLDHDLGSLVRTDADMALSGSEVATALIENFSADIPILIHSINSVQVPRIVRRLEERGFWVTRIPYSAMTELGFCEWVREAREQWRYLHRT